MFRPKIHPDFFLEPARLDVFLIRDLFFQIFCLFFQTETIRFQILRKTGFPLNPPSLKNKIQQFAFGTDVEIGGVLLRNTRIRDSRTNRTIKHRIKRRNFTCPKR